VTSGAGWSPSPRTKLTGMVAGDRSWLVVVAAVAVFGSAGCSAATGPDAPPSASSTPAVSEPSPPTVSPSESPSTSQPPSSATSAPVEEGTTLRELGFENGPLDEFSVPSQAVISARVDQPNVVTIVLARPSPQTVEEYLRATLPDQGFTIGARGGAGGGAMTFEGNGWTGGFTGTAGTSAIVLRPA
jgi:hypothetical protein